MNNLFSAVAKKTCLNANSFSFQKRQQFLKSNLRKGNLFLCSKCNWRYNINRSIHFRKCWCLIYFLHRIFRSEKIISSWEKIKLLKFKQHISFHCLNRTAPDVFQNNFRRLEHTKATRRNGTDLRMPKLERKVGKEESTTAEQRFLTLCYYTWKLSSTTFISRMHLKNILWIKL